MHVLSVALHGWTIIHVRLLLTNLLVHNVLHHQRLHHIGNELGMDVGIPDLVVKELTNGALEFGTDLLRLIADI